MATEIKLRRGTTSQHTSFNGAEGEVTFDTDLHTLIVHNNAGNGTGERLAKYSELGSALTVEDAGSDTTMFPLLSTDATGAINPKTDTSAYTYNAATGALSATTFIGAFTGNVTGNVSGTALTVTQAAQTAITSVGTLTGLSVNTSNAEASINVGTDFLKITCSDADSGVLIENASADSNHPDLILRRTNASSSISNGEGIGNILFDAKNANEDNENYSAIVARVDDKTTGSEDGSLDFNIKVDGSFVKRIELDSVGSTFIGDVVVDDGSVEIVSTDAGATVNPILSLYRNSASPAASDDLGAIQFYGEDDGGNKTLYAQIHGFAQDETGGTEDGEIHFSCMAGASFEDPVMKLTKSAVQLQANNDLILSQNSNIRFEGTTTSGSHRTTLFVENPTATNTVNLPDGTGVLEVGALASGAVEDGTSIAQDTFSTYKGQKIVFTGSSDCTIGLPDAAAGDIGSTWTVCNAGSANVIFDLDAVAAQTLKVLTGAAVTSVGTVNPHIVAGGVASLVCTAADNYILFGSGVVINT